MSRAVWLAASTLAAPLAWALVGCFVDPVHDQEVAALGPEPAGGSPGPLHRPGQPCLVCHGGLGPAHQTFSVAGTVYAIQGETVPLDTAIVDLTDSEDAGIGIETNAAGNFYVTRSIYDPYWPMHAKVSLGSSQSTMLTHVGRNGSCAGCHIEPAGPSSPGSVYLYFDQASVPDGGIP
jgi:hypothetical protein